MKTNEHIENTVPEKTTSFKTEYIINIYPSVFLVPPNYYVLIVLTILPLLSSAVLSRACVRQLQLGRRLEGVELRDERRERLWRRTNGVNTSGAALN